MLETKPQITLETPDIAKLELYRLIGEGYKAMQEGRTSTIEEVRKNLEERRAEQKKQVLRPAFLPDPNYRFISSCGPVE